MLNSPLNELIDPHPVEVNTRLAVALIYYHLFRYVWCLTPDPQMRTDGRTPWTAWATWWAGDE